MKTGSFHVYVLVYVDDLIITDSDNSYITSMVSDLNTEFSLKDLGDLSYFLRLEIQRTAIGIKLSQNKYDTDLLERTCMSSAKNYSTPMMFGKQLSAFNGDILTNAKEYRSVVDALQYLTITKSEITFSVNKLCQFVSRSRIAHWEACKKLLR